MSTNAPKVGSSPAATQQVSLADLSVSQLQQVKQSLEQELSYMTDTVAKLKAAQQAYDMSSQVLSELTPEKEGNDLMIPLTNSVFVPGKVGDCKSVLVNIGTGYFVERPVPGAKSHCEERSRVLAGNISQFAKLLGEKRNNLEMCMMILQKKLELASKESGTNVTGN
jgi:prefoldin alpha subunit